MKLSIAIFICFAISILDIEAQISKKRNPTLDNNKVALSDTLKTKTTKSVKSSKEQKATIDLYKIISSQNDTTFVDTTLTLKKEYKFNYLRKDNFGLLPFSNLGQTYNTLTYNFTKQNTMPLFGARARHFNYMEVDDINYYQVPTPFTELFYKTAFEQGQLLDAFFTTNISKQLNFSIAYKGLRSLGKYQHILTSTGNFRFTTNYQTKNKRYLAKAHIVMQDLMNEENGGLQDDDIENFESGDSEFKDRSVFDPNFEDAKSTLLGKRFYLNHAFQINQPNDSIQNNNNLYIGHVISFEDKYYNFTQTTQNDYFGEAFTSSIFDKVTLEHFYNQFYLKFNSNKLGNFKFNIDYNNYNYGYNTVVNLQGEQIANRIKDDLFALGGNYTNTIGKLQLLSNFNYNISGDFDGYVFDGKLAYPLNDDINISTNISATSSMPNYNTLLYQSDYVNYNWDNTDEFSNIETKQIAFQLNSAKLLNLNVDYTSINNYTYFKEDSQTGSVKPFQYDKTLNYLRIKLNKEITYKKFALDNTVLYQKATQDNQVFNVPEFVLRNTFYYSDHLFKKALYLQTGITFNYFTKYKMNAYDPVLAEFYVQNTTDIGNFPRLDFFLNAKVRQTRIYLKAEHLNSAFTGYNYYSAPNYPYRDFVIRFGLVWNFFL